MQELNKLRHFNKKGFVAHGIVVIKNSINDRVVQTLCQFAKSRGCTDHFVIPKPTKYRIHLFT